MDTTFAADAKCGTGASGGSGALAGTAKTTVGLDAYDLSRQRINASGRGGASFAVPQAATVTFPSSDFLTQARARFAPPGSAFYGG